LTLSESDLTEVRKIARAEANSLYIEKVEPLERRVAKLESK
jgi:hypothetical protein